MISDDIQKQIQPIIDSIAQNQSFFVDIDIPTDIKHGDYSSSIALRLSKHLKKNPIDIATEIVKKISKISNISKIEILKPGFINFWVDSTYLLQDIQNIVNNKIQYPSYYLGTNKKIIVEFAHPNTHKLFHIGHLRNVTTGESMVRILEAAGNQVIRANYQGDVGLHIAKCIWGIQHSSVKINSLKTLRDKVAFIGNTYTEGTRAYEESQEKKQEIIDINRKLYENDTEIFKLWKETRAWSLEYFEKIYARVYSKFDRYYFESELPKRGIEISHEAEKKGILEKSKGALVFIGKKYGLDTRVFINSLGFPTYEGKELALAELEFSEHGKIDKCIHVVTPEQTSFFKVTFKVEELLDEKKYKDKQFHLIYEWVNLKSGKMSSRTGNIIEGDWLIDEAKKKILNLYHCSEETAEVLAVSAVKYSILKNGVKNPIAFDFDESISLEGNSGTYIIYTYVRCQSILQKNKLTNLSLIQSNNLSSEEMHLIRLFYQFPQVVLKAVKNYAPNYIATYVYNLCQTFNLFYQNCPILKAESHKLHLRILLTHATASLIKQSLYLLGIKTVEKM